MIACQVANTGKSYTLTNKQKRSSFCTNFTLAQETGNLALLCEEPVFVWAAPSLKKQEKLGFV